MRKNMAETTTLAALLFGAALAWGQEPTPPAPAGPAAQDAKTPPAKSKLEEMLQKALQDNPDVRLAAAKLAEAEAELNRARLLVVQKVAAQYQAVEAQKAAVESKAAELEETKTKYNSGHASQGTMLATQQELIDAKAKLASLQTEMPYLLGQQSTVIDERIKDMLRGIQLRPSGADDATMLRRYYLDMTGRLPTAEEVGASARPSIQGPTADRIRAALDKPLSLDCKKKSLASIFNEISKAFQEANRGLLINNSGAVNTTADDEPGDLSIFFDAMPFGAALEWLEDAMPGNRFVVRDYGLVLVPKDDLPPGAPLLHDFLKGRGVEEKPPAKDGRQSSLHAEGLVKQVLVKADGSPGAVLVSLGLADGLVKGDLLTVFRQEDKNGRAMMIGQLRVERVGEGESRAEPAGDLMQPIQTGDRVHLTSNGK